MTWSAAAVFKDLLSELPSTVKYEHAKPDLLFTPVVMPTSESPMFRADH
jgi:hypothetical protein